AVVTPPVVGVQSGNRGGVRVSGWAVDQPVGCHHRPALNGDALTGPDVGDDLLERFVVPARSRRPDAKRASSVAGHRPPPGDAGARGLSRVVHRMSTDVLLFELGRTRF